MARRTRAELEAENLVLYRELETIRDRLDELLEDEALDDAEPAEDEADDSDRDDGEESDAEDED
jgi:hypothetical protein